MNQLKEDLRALLESKITADEAWWKIRDVRIIIQFFPKNVQRYADGLRKI
jgi:hypothetical protein